jgi:hypothetical protein
MSELRPDLAALTRFELYFSIRQFTRTMRRFAELFDYDYDMVIIFFIVAESCFQAIIPLGGAAADPDSLERAYTDSMSLGMSVFNIGEACGIPRETVRRKIKTLIDLGYLGTLEKTKSVYVPMSALLDERMLSAFRSYSADIDQFVKTVQYYSKGGA